MLKVNPVYFSRNLRDWNKRISYHHVIQCNFQYLQREICSFDQLMFVTQLNVMFLIRLHIRPGKTLYKSMLSIERAVMKMRKCSLNCCIWRYDRSILNRREYGCRTIPLKVFHTFPHEPFRNRMSKHRETCQLRSTCTMIYLLFV
jgi:hypothetical protein